MAVLANAEGDPKYNNVPSATIFDDFFWYVTAHLWTTLAKAGGTTAADDTAGVDNLLFTTAATAADYQGVTTTKANFLPVDGQEMWAQGRASYTSFSSGANSAAFHFGMWSATPNTAGSVAVPSISYTGAMIYSLSGDTTWRTQSSNATTKNNHTSTLPILEGQMNEFLIEVQKWDNNNVQVTYRVNGQQLMDAAYPNQPIVDKVAIASMVKMVVGSYVMAGTNAGSNAQTASVDYITASKARS